MVNNMIIQPMITDNIDQAYQVASFDVEHWTDFCLNWLFEITYPIERAEKVGTILYKVNGHFLLFFFRITDLESIKKILSENKIEYDLLSDGYEITLKFK